MLNLTDPDSRFLHTRNGTVQGYNAQAVVTQDQVVVAAMTRDANDLQQLEPMLQAVTQTLAAAEIARKEIVEPVFGQPKEQQGARRFTRRGLGVCDAEWKLRCATHKAAQALAPPRRQPTPTPTAA